jgi:putative NIF3 family GTP cyclohydrolase 1 type 2
VAGRLVLDLARSGIGLIAAHTNLDRVLHGTNGALAALLALRDVRILEPHALHEEVKFIVFVPPDHTAKIIEAIHRGGGGLIGNYTRCTFRARGTGTYVPGDGANPFAGETGKFEEAEEDRLEAVVPRTRIQSVVREVVQVHPYEEVAYDVVPLHDAQPKHGLGVTGQLAAKCTLSALARRVGEVCAADSASIIGKPADEVRRIAIITGSAGSSLRGIRPSEVDVLITGELSYHFATEARDRGLRVILAGHAATEKIFAPAFAATLASHARIREAGLSVHAFDSYPEPAQPVELKRPRAKGK